MISKRHFIAVANVLRIARKCPTNWDVITWIGRELEKLYVAENPRFDKTQFEIAANLPVNTGD